jgi:alpha-N-arabinofuranosidase
VQLGNAIDRRTQFNFSGLGIARAMFAPTIRRHGDLFYIVGTCVDCGSNFVITAKNPAGPWSDPTWLESIWIANNGPPAQTPAYPGHRAIWLQEFDLEKMKMRGSRSILVDRRARRLRANTRWTLRELPPLQMNDITTFSD